MSRRFSPIVWAVIALMLPVASLAGRPQAGGAPAGKVSAAAIQIKKVVSDEIKLPPEFQMALYENLVSEIQKTGKFEQVFRDGDRGAKAEPDLVVLSTDVRGFKEGSERQRQVTTVKGATSIKVHIEAVNRQGKKLIDQDAAGTVHFLGENLRATYNLSKEVAKIINQTFRTSATPAAK